MTNNYPFLEQEVDGKDYWLVQRSLALFSQRTLQKLLNE